MLDPSAFLYEFNKVLKVNLIDLMILKSKLFYDRSINYN